MRTPVAAAAAGRRILMVAPQPFFRPRGTPFSVLHRIRALLRLGHAVELATYPFGEDPGVPGLVIHRSPRPPGVTDVAIGPSVAKLALDAPLFRLAYRLARTGRYDLLHTHEEAGFFGAWLARRIGIPHVYDMHSSLPQQFGNFGRFDRRAVVAVFERLEAYTLAGAAGVIAICPELRDHVLASGYRGPLAMIENTLDFDSPAVGEADGAALRRELGVEGASVVLYTGTLESYQGLDLLVDAAPHVCRGAPGVRFVVVGGTDAQIGALRRRARERGVDAAFVFVPAVPPAEVPRYHRAADVLITCRSRGTNTPLKIYQYLRAGRPIVATAIRSHTQVLDAASAELVEATPEAIAAGVLRVLSDPARARSLAAAAVALARERYGPDAYMRRLEAFLARIPGPATAGRGAGADGAGAAAAPSGRGGIAKRGGRAR
ncbi:MAG TPA: glycosyltransferase family 4 protein [Longimicrobiales bacterium]